MILTLELWHVISLVITIIGGFWAMAKMMLNQGQKNLEEKFVLINKRLDSQEESDKRLERQVGDMRAELPREYVRRDDFIRAIGSFDVRVDQLRLTIERALLERDKH